METQLSIGQQSDEIYRSVPEHAFSANVDIKTRQAILGLLQRNKGRYLKAYQIAKEVGLPERGTQVEVRKAITELIECNSAPIISTGSGYTYATNKNMLQLYADRLNERMMGLQKRIESINKMIGDFDG